MFKLLLTGDVHLGRSYQKEEPEVAERLSSARFQALQNAVDAGNREGCRFLVIAGDLYDRVSAITAEDHRKTAEILAEFDGDVLIIPGNHDYLDPDNNRLWSKFLERSPSNTFLFEKNGLKQIGDVVFYGCICHDKHSAHNSLGWLKEQPAAEDGLFHIGIAHGAIEGLSYDAGQKYYCMTRDELLAFPMDAWLIGHTHVAFPASPEPGARIFNAGTPQQTDIADNSRGEAFVLTFQDDKSVSFFPVRTGVVDFVRRTVALSHGDSLRSRLVFPDLDASRTVLRLTLSGTAAQDEYESRSAVFRALESGFVKVEIDDSALRREITPAMIDQETRPGTRINQLLKGYADRPELLNLAYDLAVLCREGNKHVD